jgi:hypothetical protein
MGETGGKREDLLLRARFSIERLRILRRYRRSFKFVHAENIASL